jgi:hypothetical protein
LSLCLTNLTLSHEDVWGVDVYIHIFLTSALAGGEWSASRSGRFTPGERAPDTHRIGVWVDPRAGLDDVEKILYSDSNSDPSVFQPAVSRYNGTMDNVQKLNICTE